MALEKWAYLYGNKAFQVSNLGIIRSLDRNVRVFRNGGYYYAKRKGKVLVQRNSKVNPHVFVTIQWMNDNDEKILETIYVHKAVADHFVTKSNDILLAEIEGKSTCATHIIKNYYNNRYDNVRWITLGDVIRTQPKRLADSTKSWRTRRKLYGKSGTNGKNR
jgi:hypothetical protein